MVSLLFMCCVFLLSIILYGLRQHKQKQYQEWSVWTSPDVTQQSYVVSQQLSSANRKSPVPPKPASLPPAPMPAGVTTETTNVREPVIPQHFSATTVPATIGGLYSNTINGRIPSRIRPRYDDTQDGIPITTMGSTELDEYLDRKHILTGLSPQQDARRLANLDPDEVVYLDETHWFHPAACEHYPSRQTVGEELLRTVKGAWILKRPETIDTLTSSVTYQYSTLHDPDAFVFLEANGFQTVAEALAPHNPTYEI